MFTVTEATDTAEQTTDGTADETGLQGTLSKRTIVAGRGVVGSVLDDLFRVLRGELFGKAESRTCSNAAHESAAKQRAEYARPCNDGFRAEYAGRSTKSRAQSYDFTGGITGQYGLGIRFAVTLLFQFLVSGRAAQFFGRGVEYLIRYLTHKAHDRGERTTGGRTRSTTGDGTGRTGRGTEGGTGRSKAETGQQIGPLFNYLIYERTYAALLPHVAEEGVVLSFLFQLLYALRIVLTLRRVLYAFLFTEPVINEDIGQIIYGLRGILSGNDIEGHRCSGHTGTTLIEACLSTGHKIVVRIGPSVLCFLIAHVFAQRL